MKKYIPLGTALLSLVAGLSVFFNFFTATDKIIGNATSFATIGKEGVLQNIGSDKHLSYLTFEFPKTSVILYIITLILLVLVIAIAVLNFLGIGGKNAGYIFIGAAFLTFVCALISTITLFSSGTLYKYTPALASWWATGFSFLAMLSTGNVLLKGKKKHR